MNKSKLILAFLIFALAVWAQDAGATVLCRVATVTTPTGTTSENVCWSDGYWSSDSGNNGGSGGSGAGGTVEVGASSYSIPLSIAKKDPNYATCSSDVNDREANASWQTRQYQAARIASNSGVMGQGSIVNVIYSDGSLEQWVIDYPLFTDPLTPVPVPNSLQCQGGSA